MDLTGLTPFLPVYLTGVDVPSESCDDAGDVALSGVPVWKQFHHLSGSVFRPSVPSLSCVISFKKLQIKPYEQYMHFFPYLGDVMASELVEVLID